VLQEALARFGVGAASIRETGGKGVERFRREAAVETFLLDAKSNCSGLNLVNATHVFLCEPLVNPAVELQAVARVHRIGQMRPTTVWMCLVRDSVEGGVYDISAKRRLAHVSARRSESADAAAATERDANPASEAAAAAAAAQRDADAADAAMDAADSLVLQGAPLARLLLARTGMAGAIGGELVGGGGEVVARDDLFACLFSGRPRGAGDGAATAAEGIVGREAVRFLAGEAAEARRAE
jgi:E3 ubiquitin-protein ligase SHPRH